VLFEERTTGKSGNPDIPVGSKWLGLHTGREVVVESCDAQTVVLRCMKASSKRPYHSIGSTWEESPNDLLNFFKRLP